MCIAYQLLLTAPVSVAKDERTYSELKIVKNCLHSTMKDERLNDLVVLACENDLTDTINLKEITWSKIKLRRLSINRVSPSLGTSSILTNQFKLQNLFV